MNAKTALIGAGLLFVAWKALEYRKNTASNWTETVTPTVLPTSGAQTMEEYQNNWWTSPYYD